MATFDVDELEQAFRSYWTLGAVGEDWDAWSDLFTEDVVYIEHILGRKDGREAVRNWIKPIMAEYAEMYTAYEWHQVDPSSGRIVVYMQNRRDHPDGTSAPIDFPGMTVLQYAGDGKFSLEEDFWSLPEATQAGKEYYKACKAHDPDHQAKRTRLHWGNGPDWTQGAASYADSPGARAGG